MTGTKSKTTGKINRPKKEPLPPCPAMDEPRLSLFRHCRRWWIVLPAACLLLLITAFLLSNPIINWIFIHETPQTQVDAVLIGGLGKNLETAADLFKKGEAKSILITKAVPDKYKNIDAPVTLHYFIMKRLKELGIPGESIDTLPSRAFTMLDRQRMIEEWIRNKNYHSYMRFSNRYSSRLKKMQHDDTFPGGDVTLVIYPSHGKEVRRKEILSLHNTLIRMAYWSLVYRPIIRK